HRAGGRGDRRTARPRSTAQRRPAGTGLAAHLPVADVDRGAVDGPEGALGRGQRLPRRDPVPPRAGPDPRGPRPRRGAVEGHVGRPRGPHAPRGPQRPHRHRGRRTSARGDRPRSEAGSARGRGLRLPARRDAVSGVRYARGTERTGGQESLLVPDLPAGLTFPPTTFTTTGPDLTVVRSGPVSCHPLCSSVRPLRPGAPPRGRPARACPPSAPPSCCAGCGTPATSPHRSAPGTSRCTERR